MNFELFDPIHNEPYSEMIAPEAIILHGYALAEISSLLDDLHHIIQLAPFRHMNTPGGFVMSVAMSNCGSQGWITEKNGYRYDSIDPLSGHEWPPMPSSFLHLAVNAAQHSGFPDFKPDGCLINRYSPKSRLSLHQDKSEKNLAAPVVSVSLGIPAVFLFGGLNRTDKTQKFYLEHGDVVVWGGVSRLCYHGILPIKESYHSLIGNYRINLTFRQSN